MKLSTTLTLALAAITTASPVALPVEPETEALETHFNGKRCCLLLALFLLAKKPAPKPAPKPTTTTPCPTTSKTSTPCPTTSTTSTPCPTTSKTSTPCPTTSTTSTPSPTTSTTSSSTPSSTTSTTSTTSSSSSSSSSSSVPSPTPTGPETKRDTTNDDAAMSDLFNFIDAANEEDVMQFVHFYKNADQADVQAWWNGKSVSNDTGLVPDFSASRVHAIASSAAESVATATAVQTVTVGEMTTVVAYN